LRGLSVLVSSGDSGANGRTDPDCTLPYLKPDYPGCCPFITSVGATQLNNPTFSLTNPPPVCSGQGYACASGGQEVAVSYDVANFASGGGFANYAATPQYQQAAVNAYLNSGVALPPAGYFNTTGRGYPVCVSPLCSALVSSGLFWTVFGALTLCSCALLVVRRMWLPSVTLC
jgi:tripeptidyl-peptidase-1